MREAEILMSANPDVKAMGESGDLKKLHERCNSIEQVVQDEYTKAMNMIDLTVKQIDDKENALYT